MSYIRSRQGLGILDDNASQAIAGAGTKAACRPGYIPSITGSCTKMPSSNSGGFSFEKAGTFIADWWKQGQVARGRAEGAAEASSVPIQGGLGFPLPLPLILVGGAALLGVVLLARSR